MAGGTSVAVLLALCLGGALDPTTAQHDCGAPDKVVGKNSIEEVYYCVNESRDELSTTVFVLPGSDFQRVGVIGWKGDKLYRSVWLNIYQCFSDHVTWTPLDVEVVRQGRGCKTRCYYSFKLKFGKCTKTDDGAWWHNTTPFIIHLNVVAVGSSSWRRAMPPDTCNSTTVFETPTLTSVLPTCEEAPLPGTNTLDPPSLPPPDTATPLLPSCRTFVVVATVVVVLLVAVIVVLVVVVCRMRQLTPAPSHTVPLHRHPYNPATQTRGSVNVSENSLYEEVNDSLNTAASREQQEPVYVNENSLYEPFSGSLNTAASKEQQEPVYVSENSLYEQFNGSLNTAARREQEPVYVNDTVCMNLSAAP